MSLGRSFSQPQPLETLAEAWTLRPENLTFVRESRGDDHRLRCAIQLCVLLRQGRFLARPEDVPPQILVYLADQLGLTALPDLNEPVRPNTESDQHERIQQHLGFVSFGSEEESSLRAFLESKFRVDFRLDAHLEEAISFLFVRKIVSPAVSSLKRLIKSVAWSIQESLHETIAGRLSTEQTKGLEAMLLVDSDQAVSGIQALKVFPPQANPEVIYEHLERWENLRKQGLSEIHLADVAPSVVEALAAITRGHDAHTLRRVEPGIKRLSLLACFVSEASKTLLDHIVELNAQWLTGIQRRTGRRAEGRAAGVRGRLWQALHGAIEVMESLTHEPDEAKMGSFFARHARTYLLQLVVDCKTLEQSEGAKDLIDLAHGYSAMRRYAPMFFRLPFKVAAEADELMKAVEILKQLDANEVAELPQDAPISFLKSSWQRQVCDDEGHLIRSRWEMAVMLKLQEALKAGVVSLSGSRNYRAPENRILPAAVWESTREQAASELGLPVSFVGIWARLQADFSAGAKLAVEALSQGDYVHLTPSGDLKFRRERAILEPESTAVLRQRIQDRLQPVRIEQVLQEVDEICHFTEAFEPVAGMKPRGGIPSQGILAALIAEGTNLGLLDMSRSTEGFSYDRLQRIRENYFSPENLRDASRRIVNVHSRMPISQVWGDGTWSSSDGQRYGIQRSSMIASVYPRYSGYYSRMVSIYTHLGARHGTLATQVISCPEREASYVLDGLYENTSEVQPTTHTTDTHGYTDQLFGLCFLNGISFCPHVAKLGKAQLYRIDKEHGFPELEPLFEGTTNRDLIEENVDELLRLALSIKRRVISAHSLMCTLSGAAASHPLSKALTHLGQLVKTSYILRYLGDPLLRRDVRRQLNRGESRHQLAKHLRFAHKGEFRTGDLDVLLNQASCLSVLSNAILLSNTRQIERIIRELEAQGIPVDPADLARISPLSFKNVIPHGTYRFENLLELEAI